MIKAVLFDIGGVLIDQKRLVEKFIKIFKPKNTNNFWNYLNIEAIPLCKGQIKEKEFWEIVSKKYKVPASGNLWTEDFEKLTKINHKVLSIAKRLRANYKIGIISNTIAPHVKVNRKRGLFGIFDIVILSCEVNITKDAKEIFMLAAKKLKVKPEECIFIDDVKDFVETAESAGMKGIIFRNSAQLNKELEIILKAQNNLI